MEIKNKSVEELKVIAYDLMVSIQRLQNDSQIVNQLINQKLQEPTKPLKEEKTKE